MRGQQRQHAQGCDPCSVEREQPLWNLTSLTDNQVALGLFYKGLVPSERGDVLGFGFARTNINGRANAVTAPAPNGRDLGELNAEHAAELYYSLHPIAWLELRPNIQGIHQPGGRHDAHDVAVLGLKAAVTL